MSSPEFPIYISEVNCEFLLAFRFTLPEQGIGRDDVVIYVEYGITPENAETITYNVWAQFRDSLIRAFLCPGSVPGTLEAADIIPKIMYDLNSQELFYERVNEFIAHFDR